MNRWKETKWGHYVNNTLPHTALSTLVPSNTGPVFLVLLLHQQWLRFKANVH